MHEVHVVLEARVEVRLLPERDGLLEVRVVDVRVDAEEAPQDGARDGGEVGREGCADGVRDVLEHFRVELVRAMQLTGCASLKDITRDLVAD